MAWADRRLANKTAAVAAGRGAYQAPRSTFWMENH
jgi:hypothetical protein